MRSIHLQLPQLSYEAIWSHLLPNHLTEETAFVFARHEKRSDEMLLQFVDWYPIPPGGYSSRGSLHLELTDAARAQVIKRAHDLEASLVEFHSHTGPWKAQFSLSDLMGFEEFVPHVWWRLKGRPYLAVVVANSSFDGLSWIDGPNSPQRLDGIIVDRVTFKPTGLSQLKAEHYDERTLQ